MISNIFKRRTGTIKTGLYAMVLLCALVLGVAFISGQKASAVSINAPTVVATAADACANKATHGVGFFGLQPWYQFMPNELGVPAVKVNGTVTVPADPCAVHCFNFFPQTNPNDCGQTASDIPGVLLAIVDDLLRVGGLVAVAFIIVGSFQYVASRGNSERTSQAQSTVINALTGLAVVLVAVGLVTFIGDKL